MKRKGNHLGAEASIETCAGLVLASVAGPGQRSTSRPDQQSRARTPKAHALRTKTKTTCPTEMILVGETIP